MTITNIQTDSGHCKGLIASGPAAWATIRNQSDADSIFAPWMMSEVKIAPMYSISRGVMTFDLTTIAPTETVDGVTLKAYLIGAGWDDLEIPHNYNYQCVVGANISTPIVVANYNRASFSPTKYAERDYHFLNVWDTWYDFPFNVNGIAKVQAGLGAAGCGFAMIEGHDFDNVAPILGRDFGYFDAGTVPLPPPGANAPILEITHHSGGPVIMGGGIGRRNREAKRY